MEAKPHLHQQFNRIFFFKKQLVLSFLVLTLSSLSTNSTTIFRNPSLLEEDLYVPGDINLGALVRLFYPTPDGKCNDTSLARVGVQVSEAIKWTVSNINRDNTILPGLQLGYVLLNDCGREGVALAKATKFLPPSQCLKDGCGKKDGASTASAPLPFYKVAGVMGPYSSALSVVVSSLLSTYEVPHISWSATSQELSDKGRFPYFSRAVTADQYQASAMIDILKHYGWTYISTLYTRGSYGVNGIREVHRLAKAAGICVAYSRELTQEDTEEDYDKVIVQLRKNYKARIIIAFTMGYSAEGILRAVRRAEATEFIFIGSDGFQPNLEIGQKPIDGLHALVLNPRSDMDEEFKSYYTQEYFPWRDRAEDGEKSTKNDPWNGEYLAKDVGCSWEVDSKHPISCTKYKAFKDFPQFFLFPGIARVIDIVKTYARALHTLIESFCPESFQTSNVTILDNCLNGPRLLKAIRGVSFQGSSSYISFDSQGDLKGGYMIGQVKGKKGVYESELVGTWSRIDEELTINDTAILWNEENLVNVSRKHIQTGVFTIDVPLKDLYDVSNSSLFLYIPESVCAKPCGVGEFYIKGELSCCWECRRCRTNERLKKSRQGCEVCPYLEWPDNVNFTTCEPIPPTYMSFEDPIAISLICLALLGLVSVFVITVIFVKYSKHKVIKGSSRELMAPILFGVFLSYLSVFILIKKPEDWSCYTNYFTFNIGCTLIFGPLFLKTNRLYRIFKAAEKCETRVKMVDGKSQVIFYIVMLLIVIALVVAATILLPPKAILRMPIYTEKHVEQLCFMPLQNLLLPLSYNLCLLLLCGVFGFLTRALPDNFNESWYIFISVTTTTFIWIAFFPTYFMAFYAYHKSALLALALILSGVLVTFCLFAPKIYAVYYVDEKKIKVTNFGDYEESINSKETSTTKPSDSKN